MPAVSASPASADRARGDDPDEHDGRCVVEARLRLERAGQPLGQRQRPEHGEHRRGVGGRADRAEQDGQLPRQAEQVVGADGHDRDRHRDPDGRQRQAEPDARAHLSPVGGEAALGQDDRQRPEPERVGELRVVEGDPEGTALAEQRRRSAGRSAATAGRRPPRPAPRGSPPTSRPRRPARTGRAGGRRRSCTPRAIGGRREQVVPRPILSAGAGPTRPRPSAPRAVRECPVSIHVGNVWAGRLRG